MNTHSVLNIPRTGYITPRCGTLQDLSIDKGTPCQTEKDNDLTTHYVGRIAIQLLVIIDRHGAYRHANASRSGSTDSCCA